MAFIVSNEDQALTSMTLGRFREIATRLQNNPILATLAVAELQEFGRLSLALLENKQVVFPFTEREIVY